jgi:radical SAM-linked protein
MRLRVEYSVGPELKFLANLDMMHVIERALRRAEIPYLLSEGFNPHIRLSMGTVLPVGLWGDQEYFDLELNDMAEDEFERRLNSTLPQSLRIKRCRRIAGNVPSLMKAVNAAQYVFVIKPGGIDLNRLVSDIWAQEQIIVQSRGKNKKVQKDLRAGIFALNVEQVNDKSLLKVMVSINEPLNVRFDELLDVIISNGIDEKNIVDFYRQGNYIKEGNSYFTPLER